MVALNPHQFGNMKESTDYSTGRRMVTYDIDLPDRQPHEPLGVRSQAREISKNQWMVKTTHGPFEEKDESGSYYKDMGSADVKGPPSAVRSHVKRAAAESFRGLRG